MALRRITVVLVFVCLCFSGGDSSQCDSEDEKRAKVCREEDMCITVDEGSTPVTSFKYTTGTTSVTIECHYSKELTNSIMGKEDFSLQWKLGARSITEQVKCRNLRNVVYLAPGNSSIVYTCENFDHSILNIPMKHANIELQYVTEVSPQATKPEESTPSNNASHASNEAASTGTEVPESPSLNDKMKAFFQDYWVLLATGLVLFIVVILVIAAFCAMVKSRKTPKEDKRRLNPKSSIAESSSDISQHQKGTPPRPNRTNDERMNDQYAEPFCNTTSEVYSDPYTAMYSQPIPKKARNLNAPKPNLKPKIKPYFNTTGRIDKGPSIYNNISKSNAAIYDNAAEDYNDRSKPLAKHVQIYNNSVAGYCNMAGDYGSDGYSDPGLYAIPS